MNRKQWTQAALRITMETQDLSDLHLVYRKEDHFHKPNVSAILDQSGNTIIVNEDWLLTATDLEIAGTIFHEARHAYQWEQIHIRQFKAYKESLSRIKQWKKESEAYVTPTGDVDDLPYFGQDIEIDAIAFANLMTKPLFETYLFIPDSIKDRVRKRMDEIKQALTRMGTYQLLKP